MNKIIIPQCLRVAAAEGSEFFNGHHICNLLSP